MKKINLKDNLKVDERLNKIWSNRYKNNVEIISPLFQEEILTNEITFLSVNPSLPPNGRVDATRGFYPHPPYPIIDCNKNKEEKIYPFFRKFYEIGELLNKSWTMLDLLYERESTQAELENKYNPKTITEIDKIFLQSQIKLTFEILEAIKPKVVVISNAGTDKFIHNNLIDLKIIQELPCEDNGYIYKLNGIPFISIESRFLGSAQHFNRSKKDGRLEKLVKEIERVVNK